LSDLKIKYKNGKAVQVEPLKLEIGTSIITEEQTEISTMGGNTRYHFNYKQP
jgi:hypothetical protein